jgi:hypothetical protein
VTDDIELAVAQLRLEIALEEFRAEHDGDRWQCWIP